MSEDKPNRQFIKTPELGDIIKIYLSNDTSVFGRYMGKHVEMSKGRNQMTRDIALIKRVKKQYELSDCKFCFTENIVEFI